MAKVWKLVLAVLLWIGRAEAVESRNPGPGSAKGRTPIPASLPIPGLVPVSDPLSGLGSTGLEPSAGAPRLEQPALPALQESLRLIEERTLDIEKALEESGPSVQGGEEASSAGTAVFEAVRKKPAPEAVAALGAAEARPASLGQALSLVLAEHPDAAAELAARLRGSVFAPALAGVDWPRELATFMRPRLMVGARELGLASLAAYLEIFAGQGEASARERAGFARLLIERGGHRYEAWSYLFHHHPLWKAPLERYLDGLIAERKDGARRLELQSVGAGYGLEAYSLAITVERALRRAGQDPGLWTVRIKAVDVSLMSLLVAGEGLFQLGPKDAKTFAAMGLRDCFETAPGGLLRLKEPMRRWISPAYADLNDSSEHPVVLGRKTDVVFANYILPHLRQEPAAALAARWLSGEWSEHGFLSLAPNLLAELRSQAAEGPPGPGGALLGSFGEYAGMTGRNYYGDSFQVGAGVGRNLWRLLRHPSARQAAELTRSFLAGLEADPFAAQDADEGIVSWLRELAARFAIRVALSTDAVLLHFSPREKVLHVAVGWVLAGDGAKGRRDLLGRLIPAELRRGGAWPLPGMHPPGRAAPGALLLAGYTLQGALIKAARSAGKIVVRWLGPELTPLAMPSDYDQDHSQIEASRSELPEETPRQTPPMGGAHGSNLIRGLN